MGWPGVYVGAAEGARVGAADGEADRAATGVRVVGDEVGRLVGL